MSNLTGAPYTFKVEGKDVKFYPLTDADLQEVENTLRSRDIQSTVEAATLANVSGETLAYMTKGAVEASRKWDLFANSEIVKDPAFVLRAILASCKGELDYPTMTRCLAQRKLDAQVLISLALGHYLGLDAKIVNKAVEGEPQEKNPTVTNPTAENSSTATSSEPSDGGPAKSPQ